MLININKKLFPLFLKGRPSFSTEFSIYVIKRQKLIQKWINKILSEEKHRLAYKNMTKDIFVEVRSFFGGEPMMFSHLQIGNNIFCYTDGEKITFINLQFDGHSSIKESEITKKFYSKPGTFFWLFREVKNKESKEVRKKFFEFQDAI